MVTRITKLAAVALMAVAVLASVAGATGTVNYYTCVGGASGMTIQLTPYKAGGVQRGAACQVMDDVLKSQANPAFSGVCYQAYCGANMQAPTSTYSEPSLKFTGLNSQCEIDYMVDGGSNIYYSIIVRADSTIGLRFAMNRQYITSFQSAGGSIAFQDAGKNDLTNNANFQRVLTDINNRLANGGIPIEGGLSEIYADTGVNAINEWNQTYGQTSLGQQPLINPAHYPGVADSTAQTPDHLVSIAVLGIIYNQSVSPSNPLNVTTEMERMISGGYVDNWDCFFSQEMIHAPLLDFYREPLSGTCQTYKNLIMRGVPYGANGTTYTSMQYNNGPVLAPGTLANENFGSGINDLTCATTIFDTGYGNKPGSGAMLNAVDANTGSHGYTFLQKFTPMDNQEPAAWGGVYQPYTCIRVASFNGYSPYDFTNGNNLPGFGNVPDYNSSSTPYYQNVIDGKYPLWSYDHIFDATDGKSANLANYIAAFQLYPGDVRAAGLIPLSDMYTAAENRAVSTTGPNKGRGYGLDRCGFTSKVTGEFVRDGMMFLLDTANDGLHPILGESMPSEGFVGMRP